MPHPFGAILWALLAPVLAVAGADRYPDFRALAAREKEGVDYAVALEDRASSTTVLAVHGGGIEPQSDRIAAAIARQDWNFYAFKGMKPSGNRDLHLTSAHFDEPRALALVARSRRCLSIHGFRAADPAVCVGGGNAKAREKVAMALREFAKRDFRVQSACKGLEGVSPKNIVNRCREPGVQLEFSSALRDRIGVDEAFARKLADVIRTAFDGS